MRPRPLLLALLVLGAAPAAAAECDRAKLAPVPLAECLKAANAASEARLKAALDGANARIEAEGGAATVKARWKRLFGEVQDFWARFRNADCQDVAPFEGGGRADAFAARMACLAVHNEQRAEEVERRYPKKAASAEADQKSQAFRFNNGTRF